MKFVIWHDKEGWNLAADRCPVAMAARRKNVLQTLNMLMAGEEQKAKERRTDDQRGKKAGKRPDF